MRVVIVGCSRVGALLAKDLAGKGASVTVIDSKSEPLNLIGHDLPIQTVTGTGVDLDVLESAGTAEADVFVALTDRDNLNLVSAQIAKQKFKVPKVIVRVYNPELKAFSEKLGLETYCPTVYTTDFIGRQILGIPGRGTDLPDGLAPVEATDRQVGRDFGQGGDR